MLLAGYVRFSSEGQRDGYSIAAQMRAVNDFCEKEGHTIYKFYIDEAQSATDDDRESFLDMIDDAKAQKFEGIIVHKLDRFARNRYDSAIYGKVLDECDVRLMSVLEPMISDDTPEANMFRGMLETVNAYYSENLGREVLKGKNEAARECKHLGGPVPFGYMLDSKNVYTPHPDEASIVFECFSRLDAGQTASDVAKWLCAKGVKTRYGLLYNPHAVVMMTQNPVYTGRYTWGLRSTRKNFKPVVVENAFPAIVSMDVFQRVYTATIARRHGPMKRLKEVDYFLTGLMFCEHCGAHLYGFKSTTKYRKNGENVKEYVVRKYRCSNKKTTDKNQRFDPNFKHTPCQLRMFPKEQLENFVFESVKHVIFSDNMLQFIIDTLQEKALTRLPSDATKTKETERAIKALSAKSERLLELYLDGTMDKHTYQAKQKALTEQMTLLDNELQKNSFMPSTVTIDSMKKAIFTFNSATDDKNSDEYKKMLISTFVDHIDVSNEHIVIFYKLPLPGLPGYSTHDFVRNTTSVSIWHKTTISL